MKWRANLLMALGVLCLLVSLNFVSPAKANNLIQVDDLGQKVRNIQPAGDCVFQDPRVGLTTTNLFHDEANGGSLRNADTVSNGAWPGEDFGPSSGYNYETAGAKNIFASDNSTIRFAGNDGGTGANGVIIEGTGNCQGWLFHAWHDNNPPSYAVGSIAPSDEILVHPGKSGFWTTGPHIHVGIGSYNVADVCGTNGIFDIDSKAYWYPIDVILDCYGSSAGAQEIATPVENHAKTYCLNCQDSGGLMTNNMAMMYAYVQANQNVAAAQALIDSGYFEGSHTFLSSSQEISMNELFGPYTTVEGQQHLYGIDGAGICNTQSMDWEVFDLNGVKTRITDWCKGHKVGESGKTVPMPGVNSEYWYTIQSDTQCDIWIKPQETFTLHWKVEKIAPNTNLTLWVTWDSNPGKVTTHDPPPKDPIEPPKLERVYTPNEILFSVPIQYGAEKSSTPVAPTPSLWEEWNDQSCIRNANGQTCDLTVASGWMAWQRLWDTRSGEIIFWMIVFFIGATIVLLVIGAFRKLFHQGGKTIK